MKTQHYVLLALLFGWSQHSFGQLEIVSKLLPDDTAVVVFADDIPALADRIREFPLFEDEHFDKALEIACNETNPLIHEDKWEPLLDKLEALVSDPERVEQLYLAIHSIDPKDVRYTVLLKSRPGQNEKMGSAIGGFIEFLKEINKEEDVSESNEHVEDGELRTLEFFGSHQARFGDWSIVGNDRDQIENIGKRIEGKRVGRTLDEARVFHATRNRLNSKWAKPGVIHVFVRPDALRPYFTDIEDETWKAMRVSELPGAAVQISLNDANPYIVANTIIQFTSPATGIAKQWQAYREIKEWPRLPYEIVGLNALAFERAELESAKAEIHDEIHGEGDYVRNKMERYKKLEMDYEEDFIKRSNTYFAAYFYNQNQYRMFALFEKVVNYDAMHQYAKGMVKLDNNDKKNFPVQEIKIDKQFDFKVWGMTNEGMYEWYKDFVDEVVKKPEDFTYKTSTQLAFALSDQWYVHSPIMFLEDIFASLHGMKEQEGFETVKENVVEIEKGLGFSKQACHVKVDSFATYGYIPNEILQQYFYSKFNYSRYDGNGNYDRPPPALVEILKAIRQNELKPDLDDTGDVVAVTQYHLLRSLTNTLDKQYMVYSVDGSTMQVGVTLSGKTKSKE